MRPIRRTPFHQAFSEANCVFQNAGDWLYSRYFPLAGESMQQAIEREVCAVRNAVGCTDMSTLGKIEIRGTDALEFLQRVFCNDLGTLQPGRLRYALLLREDGILFDDGTVAQLGDQHYLAMTTTANADSVWRWFNRLWQCDWPDLDIHLTSVSEQWASLAIAGPRARDLLHRLNPDFSIDGNHFPFASVRSGELDGEIPCRVLRVSFSGELSYEVNVPAGYAGELYRRVIRRGEALGITPYGLEALDVLRIEKGHIAVGTEIDGRTTPADLGLGRLVSTKKSFIGASLLKRPALQHGARPQLVGLTPVDEGASIPPAALLTDRAWQSGEPQAERGLLTAAIQSPTLNRSIALGLLHDAERHRGKTLWAVAPTANQSVEVTVGPPCFFDPKGERLHG